MDMSGEKDGGERRREMERGGGKLEMEEDRYEEE